MALDLSFDVGTTEYIQPFQKLKIGFKPGRLLLTVELNNIRVWYGNQIPTPLNGHKIVVGTFYSSVIGPEIESLKIISTSGVARIFASVSGT